VFKFDEEMSVHAHLTLSLSTFRYRQIFFLTFSTFLFEDLLKILMFLKIFNSKPLFETPTQARGKSNNTPDLKRPEIKIGGEE
jgi:hypothetical protein